MDGRKKLLYIMGIDWNWIFQRPQILEQYLENNYDVTVVFPRSILKLMDKSYTKYPSDYKILWTFPLQEKNRFIGRISKLFAKRVFRNIEQYDLVVIGYPLYFRYVPSTFRGKVIYDCMDNYEELYPDRKNVSKITKSEKELIERSDAVIVTANKLLEKVSAYTKDKKVTLVRNGTENRVISTPGEPRVQEKYKIGYFGTVAEWLDAKLLEESLEEYPDIEYHLIGPVLNAEIPVNRRIIMEGIVPKQNLPELTKEYSCLIMPFVVNGIVEGVDPVKLYEYISMGKCIISVKYQEIERFDEYVYMYSNKEEYFELLRDLKAKGFPPKYDKKKQAGFLTENSWENRFKAFDKILCNAMQN